MASAESPSTDFLWPRLAPGSRTGIHALLVDEGELREIQDVNGEQLSPLHIQTWLRSGAHPDGLKTSFGIRHRRHGQHPNLISFKYDMVDSPMSEPIVRECRGIVLDEANDWAVVARGFDKFFNHGEGHADTIDWNTAHVLEKVDGSLCVMYEYAGEWHVATTGTPDAGGDVNRGGILFADLFWHTLKGDFASKDAVCPDPLSSARHFSFMFELTGPLNRIVVPHEKAGLTFLGARNRVTGEEESPVEGQALFGAYCPKPVRYFSLGSVADVIDSFASISPLAQEGYVVVDAAFRRIKVKHPGYLTLHHAKDGMSTKSFVEIARSGETSEVLTAFPEFGTAVTEATRRIDALVSELDAAYEPIRDIVAQKDFAAEALKTKLPPALFMVRKGGAESMRAFVRSMRLEALVDLLGYPG